MMEFIGLSHGYHDACKVILKDEEIVSAVHAERSSRIKNDPNLNPDWEVEIFCRSNCFYERPFIKNLRRIYAGQSWKSMPEYDHYVPHHWSHAAAAYYTRPFRQEPVCVVIDAIGEWDTASIWYKKKKVWSMKYPRSLGLFYSAITKSVGLKPNEDEYILMGMAAYGTPVHDLEYLLRENNHRGLSQPLSGSEFDIAASAQDLLEKEVFKIMLRASSYSKYLCYGGGVALNCVANSKFAHLFKEIWIMPNPGDGGSALGAAAAINDRMLNWKHPYLGYDIDREINPKEVVKYLKKHSVCGVANGRAEFGPRALGNRSLLADPRKDIKDTVNHIKQRQTFRPFAPAILEEFADSYFEGPMNEYMQFVAKAKHDYKSVTHIDGTARVQIVKKDNPSIIRKILEEWYDETDCPMLLNTSLNIKGQPMVDTWAHAQEFENKYGVKVF